MTDEEKKERIRQQTNARKRRFRARRKNAGLSEWRVWLTDAEFKEFKRELKIYRRKHKGEQNEQQA